MVPPHPAECLARWLGRGERSGIIARNASSTAAAADPRQTPLVGKIDLADPYRVIWPPSVTDPYVRSAICRQRIGLRYPRLEFLEAGLGQLGGGLDDVPGDADPQKAFDDFDLLAGFASGFAFGSSFIQ